MFDDLVNSSIKLASSSSSKSFQCQAILNGLTVSVSLSNVITIRIRNRNEASHIKHNEVAFTTPNINIAEFVMTLTAACIY